MMGSTPLSESRKTRALSAGFCFLSVCNSEALQRKRMAKASGRGSSGVSAFKPTGLRAALSEAAAVRINAPNLTVAPPVAMHFCTTATQKRRVCGNRVTTINKIQDT
jgi:hypothetical protein